MRSCGGRKDGGVRPYDLVDVEGCDGMKIVIHPYRRLRLCLREARIRFLLLCPNQDPLVVHIRRALEETLGLPVSSTIVR